MNRASLFRVFESGTSALRAQIQAATYRLAAGGRIDRARPLRFTFDGRSFEGYHGDTLASALLANGVRVIARSFKFHRPRGVWSAGVDEPNAIVTVGSGAFMETNVRATLLPLYAGLEARAQNGWPSVRFDFGRLTDLLHGLFPAGFYNKTFMWPSWRWYEPLVRRAAGLGPAPRATDPDAYESRHASCDVLVAGGGASGLLASLAAARAGARVMLAEQEPELGGSLRWEREGAGAERYVRELVGALSRLPNVRVLTLACVAAAYDHGVFGIHQRLVTGHGPKPAASRERFWQVRARELVLATGAIEQPLVFPNNDRPGVMLASAVRRYVNQYAVVPGRRVVVATNNDIAYRTAFDLRAAGIDVACLLDTRSEPPVELVAEARKRDVWVVSSATITDTDGSPALRSVTVESVDGRRERVECDCLAVSAGVNPTLHLLSQARGRLRFDPATRCLVPRELPAGVSVIGVASGELDRARAWRHAIAAGIASAGRCGHHFRVDIDLPALVETSFAPVGPPMDPKRKRSRSWVDLAHDVTAQDIDIAVRENFVSVEHMKRFTTTGMSTDQGKTSNLNALTMLAKATSRSVDETGTTTFRPPFAPVTLGAIAGGRSGHFHRVARELPTHDEQTRLGAAFEDVGGWLRPVAYPRPGEQEADAVAREVGAVRNGVGLFETSPLGKILVRGPDAAEFLDRIYANTVRTLAVGKVRYGIMLNEKGVIIDDGVCARLGEEGFWVSTTSGAAARIASWMEEWLQCEWTGLRVVVTPVTAQWATLTVAGPRARDLLIRLPSDIDFSREAFPHMHVRDGWLCDFDARIFRVSFSGELSYEINVPADHGPALWGALMEHGHGLGIAPYGIEALQTMRVEKGYIHVGSDTDGTTVPDDIGLGAAVKRKSGDFIGRRSLSLAENRRKDRLQLVGVLARDREAPLVAGAHFVARAATRSGRKSEGYVTSAYFSPTLGHYIALGLLARGRARHGESVMLFSQGRELHAKVVAPTFYDPTGERLNA